MMMRTVVSLTVLVLACSDAGAPPTIGDVEGGLVQGHGTTSSPCSTPAPGCACSDAGAQHDCGRVYRTSGQYVSCEEGKMTCGDDGVWGACIGPSVYDGG